MPDPLEEKFEKCRAEFIQLLKDDQFDLANIAFRRLQELYKLIKESEAVV